MGYKDIIRNVVIEWNGQSVKTGLRRAAELAGLSGDVSPIHAQLG